MLTLACQSGENASTQPSTPVKKSEDAATPKACPPKFALELTISEEAQERAGVVMAKAQGVPARVSTMIPAELQADPARVAHVSALVSGQLVAVHAEVGSRVKAGDPLAILRSIELGQARSALVRAQANLEVSQANFRRQEELQKANIGSRREYVEAQARVRREEAELTAAQRSLGVYGRGGSGSDIPIRAPIDGYVVARHATMGEVVHPSDELFELTDVDKVWAIGRLGQKQVASAAVGVPVTLYLDGLNDRTWTGIIDYVAPTLDATTRTLQVRVIFDNPDGALRAGMFGELALGRTGAHADELQAQVDAQAIATIDGQEYIFVPQGNDKFRAVPVSVTPAIHQRVQVRSGLNIGDAYVASGAFVLKSELLRSELVSGE
jgi:cobalt-zinc-cadmium efflux system membrane fusion protein